MLGKPLPIEHNGVKGLYPDDEDDTAIQRQAARLSPL
jgi:hypothetical protein